MEEKKIEEYLIRVAGDSQVRFYEPMRNHTTFRIGGAARYYVMPDTVEQIQKITAFCREEKLEYVIIGNGSNLLVSDEGYDGVVIQLFRNFADIEVKGTKMRVQAGALLSRTARTAADAGLTGMEFAAGIPGTVGGAVYMNAGAYGGEMRQVVVRAVILDDAGEIRTLSVEELGLDYRTSVLQRNGGIVLEVELELMNGSKDAIAARMEELKELRTTKQPLEYPSAGSTFKRPEGNYAGKLIMEAGFRGYQVGGARVSDKHCGFVVNMGGATAADVIKLTDQIKEKVYKDTGVMLELEVRKLGKV